jgi:DNA-binding transcriptional ArsR family regulator
MSQGVAVAPQRPAEAPSVPPAGTDDGDAVARALAVPTRAGIYRRLRTEGQPLTAREVADMFGLHPNVARNHLDQLAEA